MDFDAVALVEPEEEKEEMYAKSGLSRQGYE